jgi:hypothetical protein
MPQISEIRADEQGRVWVRVDLAGDSGAITLWTPSEEAEAKRQAFNEGIEAAAELLERFQYTTSNVPPFRHLEESDYPDETRRTYAAGIRGLAKKRASSL